jgi:hypothetical protein
LAPTNSARRCAAILASLFAIVLSGCNSFAPKSSEAAKPVEPVAQARPTIRINAGADHPITDVTGVKWEADRGFDGGLTNDRTELQVTGTKTPELYQTERYSMNYYNIKVPNGSYMLRLHFSEDYEGIGDASGRIFTYAVKDGSPTAGKLVKEVKDFSPWKASGAQYKAYIDTVPINVTAEQISITFTAQVENPQINAIEIIPN